MARHTIPQRRCWSPQDINRLIVIVTGCLCLNILVIGVVLLIYAGKIAPELFGTTKGIGVGGGILGLASVVFGVIKCGLPAEDKAAKDAKTHDGKGGDEK